MQAGRTVQPVRPAADSLYLDLDSGSVKSAPARQDQPDQREARADQQDHGERVAPTKLELVRCKQFNRFRGVTDFPVEPGDLLPSRRE